MEEELVPKRPPPSTEASLSTTETLCQALSLLSPSSKTAPPLPDDAILPLTVTSRVISSTAAVTPATPPPPPLASQSAITT
eukprot:73055-Rhodomonas_salina.2